MSKDRRMLNYYKQMENQKLHVNVEELETYLTNVREKKYYNNDIRGRDNDNRRGRTKKI